MAEYNSVATHQLNKWLWTKLKVLPWGTGLAFDPAPWTSIGVSQPFFPSQQVPEASNLPSGQPYVVYNYSYSTTTDWIIKAEQVAYIIYDNNESRLRNIHNYMVDLISRDDWSARAVNSFLGPTSKYDFKTVRFVSANGPDAFTQEGGRQGAMVVVRIVYTYVLDTVEGSGLRA